MTADPEPNGARPSVERYLAAIYVLEEEGPAEVIQARIAERMGHSAPTVSEMVHRLKADGYITVEGRRVSLTDRGRQLAAGIVRKHCLAARLMTDVLGLPWHEVHVEAERWEHVMSDDVATLLEQVLGHPTTCPHGNPIPGSCAQTGPVGLLADAAVGQRFCLARIMDLAQFDQEALTYFEQQRFTPGCEATVVEKGPDGSLVLQVGDGSAVDGTVVMGASVAKLLSVTPSG